MITDLASLLAPEAESTFIRHFLAKERLLVKATKPDRAAGLLPWETINTLLASESFPPAALKLVRTDTVIPPEIFRGEKHARLRPGAVEELAARGMSIVVNRIDDYVPAIAALNDAVERRLGHETCTNLYLSFTREGAFKAHADDHDVIVVQVHGAKQWRSHGIPVPHPVKSSGHRTPSVVWETLLEPGDVLYLPRGEVHEAVVQGPHAVHLTIGINTLRGVDFVQWLARQAADDVTLRMDLTRLAGDEAARHAARVKERIHALVDRMSVESFLEAADGDRWPRTVMNLGAGQDPQDDHRIVPAPRRRLPFTPGSDADRTVRIGGEPIRLSAQGHRLLSSLIESNGATLGELSARFGATMSDGDLRAAVRRLLAQGLVSLAPPPR